MTDECRRTNDSCASSKHLQTRRFLDTIAQYLTDVQKLVMHIHRLANERSDAFMDHSGTLIDSRTGAPLVVLPEEEDEDAVLASGAGKKDGTVTPGGLAGVEDGVYTEGYSFYDSVSAFYTFSFSFGWALLRGIY